MPGKANYRIVRDGVSNPLVIKDMGPWDQYMTVTNAAEDVVEELVAQGHLGIGRRLFYYDSEGELGELLISSDSKFAGFAPAREADL